MRALATLSCTLSCLALLAGCPARVESGHFACEPGKVGSCPAGWFCQCRGAGCKHHCWADEGPYCGDGILNGGEVCDGTQLGADSCRAHGFYGGTLGCSDDCGEVLVGGCSGVCGDGTGDGPEVCDGADLKTATCESRGWYGGELRCQPGCAAFDAAQCEGTCGDGVVNGAEKCDGLGRAEASCLDFGAQAGVLGCSSACDLTVGTCISSRWREWDRVQGQLKGLWGTTTGELFAVGKKGALRHFDGQAWSAMASPTTKDLLAVWGSGPSDVFAVGEGGTLLRYDGKAWRLETVPTTATLYSVTGCSATNVLVGSEAGMILRFDGTSWRLEAVPGSTSKLTSLACAGDEAWAIDEVRLRHYARGTWHPSEAEAVSVWANAPTDVLAVLTLGRLKRFDSVTNTWLDVASFPSEPLQTVWSSGPDNIWLAGDNGAVEHFDGVRWTSLPANSTDWRIEALWGRAGNDLWAVGSLFQSQISATFHWESVFGRVEAKTFKELSAVWGSSATDVLVAGEAVRRFDGVDFRDVPAPAGSWIRSLWGSGPTDVWAADFFGAILHYDGQAFSPAGPAGPMLMAVWGAAADDVFVAGYDGHLAHFDGAAWTPMTSGATGALYGLWGTSGRDVYAVGEEALLHYDGVSWSPATSNVTSTLRAVWGSGPGDVWAVGEYGAILHYDGARWERVPGGADLQLTGLWGSSPRDIYAVGTKQRLLRWDGSTWSPIAHQAGEILNSVWGAGPGDVWAAGGFGSVVHLSARLTEEGGGACENAVPLGCGARIPGTTRGGARRFIKYDDAPRQEPGDEVVYRLDAPIDGSIEVKLTPVGGDLDLLALGARVEGGCATQSPVLAASQGHGQVEERVTLETESARTYYLAVDGPALADVSYWLEVQCTKRP
ncbi:MAG: hypothetical protein QM765_47870 [Myxococcales bacterium]